MPPKAIRPLLIGSLVIAVAASAGETLLLYVFPGRYSILVGIELVAVWIAVVCIGFFRYRWRGLWFLVGAPFALFYPGLLLRVLWSCAHNIKACP
jgi:hypothetical protein